MKKIILLLCIVLGASQLKAQEEWRVAIGDKVPSFTVKNKQEEPIPVAALRGKVVLLNFFATWCPPCRQELPRLQKEVWEKWGEREDMEVMVLAREEGWDKLDPFMEKNQYSFPVYPDLKREVFSLFAESLIPRNVLINKEGKIIYQSVGYSAEEFTKLVELIEKSLAE